MRSYRFERLLSECWQSLYLHMCSENGARAIFVDKFGDKPFHDPASPRLKPLLELLSIEGRAIEKFKHYIYLAAGLLLHRARQIDNPLVVSPKFLELCLMRSSYDG
jgi:hypothetical protein